MDINELVKNAIQTQIVTVLQDTPKALEDLVKAAVIDYKVNQEGYKDQYSSHNTMPYLDAIVGKIIRNFADQVVRETLIERGDEFKAIIKQRIESDALVDKMFESLVGTLKEDWKVEINFKRDKSS